MIQKFLTAISLTIFVLLALVNVAYAQAGDPVATAQAADQAAKDAQWQVNRSAAAVRSAQATSRAAWSEVTRQVQEATVTAVWVATATPAAATQAAQVTADALQVRATQGAIDTRATQAAYTHQVEVTRQAGDLAATATLAATWAELDQLDLQRARMANRIYAVGIPIVALALALVVGALVIRVSRPAATQANDGVIDVEFYPAGDNGVYAPPRLLLPSRIGERPCVLRPIEPGQSRRPTPTSTR